MMPICEMDYFERLAHYEQEKMELKRAAQNGEELEAAIIMLAKKWRV